jgi:hypothetical protein
MALDPEAGSEPDATTDADPGADLSPIGLGRALLLGVVSAVLFGVGLYFTELVPEVLTDVDLKPFFVPYLLIAAVPFGIPTLSIAFGGAVGEGFLDIFEGYELDDPFGFLGYVFGFFVFGWFLENVAEDPTDRSTLAVAALLAALVQALFEGVALVIFGAESGPVDAVVSVLGNTVTHGLLLGAVPLVVLYPLLGDWLASRLY